MSRVTIMRAYLASVMIVLCVVAYMSFTQPIETKRPDEQGRIYSLVPEAKPGPPPTATNVGRGEPLAYMEIPRFGDDWFWTVLEGTALPILDKGPGHYIGTALPGEEGNSSFAAHRSTHGDPFLDFDKLEKGDEIILSQKGAEWTYIVSDEPKIIESDAGWVVENNEPGKWLTLTTCWPKYGSEKRMYVKAELENQ